MFSACRVWARVLLDGDLVRHNNNQIWIKVGRKRLCFSGILSMMSDTCNNNLSLSVARQPLLQDLHWQAAIVPKGYIHSADSWSNVARRRTILKIAVHICHIYMWWGKRVQLKKILRLLFNCCAFPFCTAINISEGLDRITNGWINWWATVKIAYLLWQNLVCPRAISNSRHLYFQSIIPHTTSRVKVVISIHLLNNKWYQTIITKAPDFCWRIVDSITYKNVIFLDAATGTGSH